MIDLKTPIHKTSANPRVLNLEIGLRQSKKNRATGKFHPVSSEFTKHFCSFFLCDKIRIPEELKKQVVEGLHFGISSTTKMLAKSSIF